MTDPKTIDVLFNAVCVACGYPLYGLPSQTCPECGRWFDPRDPSTFRVGGQTPDWRRFARPPSMMECVLLAALTVYGLVAASGPGRWEAGAATCLILLVGTPLWVGIPSRGSIEMSTTA